MTLEKTLESRFRGDIRYRGMAYLKAERVEIIRVTSLQVCGSVRDGGNYETQLTRDGDDLRMFCTCASNPQKDVTCKHVWATVLAIDEGELLTATPGPGHFPPFAVETAGFDHLPSDYEEDDFLDSLIMPENATAVRSGPSRQEPVLSEWEKRLLSLRNDMQNSDASVSRSSPDREIFYGIDIEKSRELGILVIQTSQRQRRANGQWGKLKDLKLRGNRLDEIQRADDRRILAYLCGGTPERSSWYAQQAETQSAVHRFRIPGELSELLLPMICETGRLRFLSDSVKNADSLSWDDGEPWELTMSVEPVDVPDKHWGLTAELRRGDERLSLEGTELIVPGGLVFSSTHAARLEDFDAAEWLDLLTGADRLSVPDGEEHALVDTLLDMPALPRLDLPESLRLEEVVCDPKPRLLVRAPRSGRWNYERLQGEVFFDYLGVALPGSSHRWAVVQRDQQRCLLRNREVEQQAWSQLEEAGFRRLLDRRRGTLDVEIAAKDLGSGVRQLMKAGWEVLADGMQVRQASELRFEVQSGIDWFELHAEAEFGGGKVSFPELLSALSRGDSTVRLDDGSIGILPEDWASRLGLIAGLGTVDEEHLRFDRTQVGLLDALLASETEVNYDDAFLKLKARLEEFEGVNSAEEPVDFDGALRPYQKEGLGWLQFLAEFGFGGCLADDMGLGKTVQLLAMLLKRRDLNEPRRPSLIVVPKSLLFNWHQECERFTPQVRRMEYTGQERAALRDEFSKTDLVLTTYGTLRRDIMDLRESEFDYVVLDEAQTIKNSGSQVAKASRLLRARYRIALSGTPIENHLGDLWSIFEFLNPGMLGRSSVFKQFAADTLNEKVRQQLSQGLKPFILRRTKQQVASELPEKLEQTIVCDLGEEQKRRYDEMRSHYRDSLLGLVDSEGIKRSKMHVLEALLRLRQAACHPGLIDESLREESSAKLDVLIPQLRELVAEGHKALVFSQFTSMLSILKHHLDEQDVTYEYLDGQTRDRKARVERFQNESECGIFLVSLKAGGLGLNLTAADYVFLLDPWWNPAVESQAIDRAHRLGQTRRVFAYRLISRNTVEEKIAALQSKKKSLADAILESDQKNILRSLSREDLELLLS